LPGNRGRPDLEPEKAWTEELGADWQVGGAAWLSLAVFRRSATALIDWARPVNDSAAPWETRNVESATFHGLEAELSGINIAGANLTVQASLLSVSAADADGYVSKYALRPLMRDVSVSVERSVGPVTAVTRVSNRRRKDEAGYWLLDLRLALSMRLGQFYFDMLNGFQVDYADITGAPAASRSIRLGYRIER
jgi:iron complex outermembrane receptor protein